MTLRASSRFADLVTLEGRLERGTIWKGNFITVPPPLLDLRGDVRDASSLPSSMPKFSSVESSGESSHPCKIRADDATGRRRNGAESGRIRVSPLPRIGAQRVWRGEAVRLERGNLT